MPPAKRSSKATPQAKPHAFTGRSFFEERVDEPGRIVMHSLEHLQLTGGEEPDTGCGVVTGV